MKRKKERKKRSHRNRNAEDGREKGKGVTEGSAGRLDYFLNE
jgi:hypothetical protein